MKPGNLLIQGAKSGGKTRDEDSIFRTSSPSVCGFLLQNALASPYGRGAQACDGGEVEEEYPLSDAFWRASSPKGRAK